jgi:hypothetical protein
MRIGSILAVALLLAGCPEDGDNPAGDAAQLDGRVGDIGPGGAGGQAGEGGQGGAGGGDSGIGGQGGLPDAGSDAAPMDQGVPRDMFAGTEVNSCQQACDRYASCERLTELFGDEDACLARCERVARGGRVPENWWSCLEVEECNLIQLCRVPAFEPLSCPEVCTRATECGIDLPDCEAACGEAGEAFQVCGEGILSSCENETFISCLGEQVYTACDRTCEQGVRCNILRSEGCLLDCVSALADGDPLFSLRATQRNQCVSRAGEDCASINECINPPGPGEEPIANPDAFCRLWSGCGFDDFFPCQDLVREVGADPAFLACAIDFFARGCPGDPFLIFDSCQPGGGGANPQLEICGRLCDAQGICDLLPADPLARVACVQNCTGGENVDPDETERAAAALECVVENRCPDLVACLDEIGPAVECREHCARLAQCGQGFDGCEADCDGVWARDRHAAYRECVATARDCGAAAACQIAPGAPCAAYCERAVGCGLEPPQGCEGRCDDAHFADPTNQLLFDACVISAPVCSADNRNDPSVFTCQGRPTDGLACLGYCRFTTECGDAGDLGECLTRCGQGFVGDDGLRFLGSRDCLRQQPVEAACAELDACIPDDLNVDCPAFCGRAAACGVELADCQNACARDPLARLRTLQQADCLANAGNDCSAVRTCLVPEIVVPEGPPPVDVPLLCAAWNGCGLDQFFGPCEQVLRDLGNDPNANRCIFDIIGARCPANIEDIFICFQREPPVSPIAVECAALCEARAFCDDPGGRDQVNCRRACESQIDPNDVDSVARFAPTLACAGAWSCPDLGTCLDSSTPRGICAEHCARRAECGDNINPAVCIAVCDRDFPRLRQFDYRDCVNRAADCAAVQACEVAPGVPCDEACALREACGPVPANCANACDDAHVRQPLDTALEVACILGAEGCDGEAGIAACFDDPGPGARACLGYCRAITECDPNAELGLIDCLNGCVGGFRDANGLRFAASRDCLLGVPPDAECGVVQACLPAEVRVDCPAYCAELGACRVPDPDCAAACAAGEISLDQGGCVADARRAGNGCGAVAECVGHVPEAASTACVEACEIRSGCDREVDPYLCRLDCTPAPAALPIQVACAEVLDCGREQNACFNLPANLDPACVAACQGAEACVGLFESANDCAATCTGQIASGLPLPGWADEIDACLGGAIVGGRCNVAVARQCFEVGVRLGANNGFGHHGSCDTFNDCGDAQTCANAACAFNGHGEAISWEEGLCMDLAAQLPGGMDCNLFFAIPDQLDDQWDNGCNIPVAYDIVCRP